MGKGKMIRQMIRQSILRAVKNDKLANRFVKVIAIAPSM